MISLPEPIWKDLVKLAAKGVGAGALIAEANAQYLAVEEYRAKCLPHLREQHLKQEREDYVD